MDIIIVNIYSLLMFEEYIFFTSNCTGVSARGTLKESNAISRARLTRVIVGSPSSSIFYLSFEQSRSQLWPHYFRHVLMESVWILSNDMHMYRNKPEINHLTRFFRSISSMSQIKRYKQKNTIQLFSIYIPTFLQEYFLKVL